MQQECRERFLRHRLQRKSLVSDLGMHHGTCVTHVSWCMPGSLTSGIGEIVQGTHSACATRIFTYLARDPLHWYQIICWFAWLSVRYVTLPYMLVTHNTDLDVLITYVLCQTWGLPSPITACITCWGVYIVRTLKRTLYYSNHPPTRRIVGIYRNELRWTALVSGRISRLGRFSYSWLGILAFFFCMYCLVPIIIDLLAASYSNFW